MTAGLIIEKAVQMLGFSGIEDARIQKCALNALNRIYAELFFLQKNEGFCEITDVTQEIELDERILKDVMPYGVASLIAVSLGDSENHNFFGQIYNLKRKKHSSDNVEDVLPTV